MRVTRPKRSRNKLYVSGEEKGKKAKWLSEETGIAQIHCREQREEQHCASEGKSCSTQRKKGGIENVWGKKKRRVSASSSQESGALDSSGEAYP